MRKGEFELGCKRFYPCTKVSLSQGGELVEEGLDDSGIDHYHGELECEPEAALDEHSRISRNAHKKPVNQGTKRSPAHLNIHKKADKNGAPITTASIHPLMRSVTKSFHVVLLKPCFSSRTKVW